jgi:hypothetical protein
VDQLKGVVSVAINFFSRTRWDRFFHLVH